jgi:hypothetical protein
MLPFAFATNKADLPGGYRVSWVVGWWALSPLCRPPENKADLHMGPFLAAGSPNTALVQCVGYGVQAARPGFLDFSNQRQQICGKLIGAALSRGRAACSEGCPKPFPELLRPVAPP